MEKDNIYFVSGIDTNIGKSYATGFLARLWNERGTRTITQKPVQTGNEGISEDIGLHRRIMGCGLLLEDREGLTMPEIFSYPCSPHLAAEIDGRPIDFAKIEAATEELSRRYDAVLVEGAGGLMVPLTRELLTIDYIAGHGYPLIFVTSGRLGSINHLLLSLEAVRLRNIPLHTLVYNTYPADGDGIIRRDTENFTRDYLSRNFPGAEFIVMPCIEEG
ncbi:MAG: ATP-dependent dethiobiotin synthetase BioD [Bacteroidetes bacterium]|uniref:ATP-dependent dethiobiotin synthetase BioD n=1 Tax=Candidatus Cryptobacteroides merdigallinarum TaxID=2840770 RepID=A0A9D9EHQ5_9BACT|nr:ATP-dependent dethiobiotin synthetase BioD [Candidatus Cryptobacteroides merdigallinarum]